MVLLEALDAVFAASHTHTTERINFVRESARKVDLAKFLLQLAWECKILDTKKYVALSQPLDEAGRMLGGWMKQLTQITFPPR